MFHLQSHDRPVVSVPVFVPINNDQMMQAGVACKLLEIPIIKKYIVIISWLSNLNIDDV